mmetsp:Transcript_30556/g.94635  ORF Transcript_30556/g.94635 Transcript_30556/m.94635 type:complete len:101 (-) Transcript_30556:100-402(-)
MAPRSSNVAGAYDVAARRVARRLCLGPAQRGVAAARSHVRVGAAGRNATRASAVTSNDANTTRARDARSRDAPDIVCPPAVLISLLLSYHLDYTTSPSRN